MNTKRSKRRDGLSLAGTQRLLLLSLGLLLSGLAHGQAAEDVAKDCRPATQEQTRQEGQGPAADCNKPAQENGIIQRMVSLLLPLLSAQSTAENPPAQDSGSDAQADEAQTTDDKTDTSSSQESATPSADEQSGATQDDTEQSTTTQGTDEATTGAQDTGPAADPPATDGAGGEMDGSAVAPQQTTELFIGEVETPETDQGVVESERDLFNLGITSQSNDDDFDSRTFSLSYRNHRRGWFWPWQEAASSGPDWGLNLDRTRGTYGQTEFRSVHVQATLGTYLNAESYIQAQAGQHALQTDLGDRTITSHSLSAIFGEGRDFGLQLEASRDFIYPEGAVPGGIAQQMTARDYTGSVRWRPAYRWRLLGQGNRREYDDENNSHQGTMSILYGVSPEWPWIWAGVGAQYLSFKRQVADYWSPKRFTAYGLRFDSSFPITQRLTGTAAANLDKLDEDGSTGTGYYLQAGVQYRLHGELYARLDLTGSKSIQRTTTWSSNSIIFWLSSPLL
jgi:hypothetical protein